MVTELTRLAAFLLIFNNVGTLYWNRDLKTGKSSKRYFQLSIFPDLLGLEIPSVIWNMTICDDPCLQSERQVLLHIRSLLSGENWENKWDINRNGQIVSNSFHCDWYGILCESETYHILGIHLEKNKLLGNVAMDFKGLQFLLSLRISADPVQGQFDKIVAAAPHYLIRLDLSDTKIGGRIPRGIAKSLPLLSKLQLSGSLVCGEIPDAIGDLMHLTVLSLGETKLNGSIPPSISKLAKLWFLDLEILKLEGKLSFLYNLGSLRYLHLLSNQITGEIPEDIGERCPNLTELLLPHNKLSGHLPRSIGKLKHLTVMNVENNNLSGLIPSDLFKLDLKALVLSSNNFTGFEKGSNHTFKSLEMFIASHLSNFNSSLHTVLSHIKGSQKSIMQIDLSHSNLYGHLPGVIFTFQRLTSLKLVGNNLSGPIPEPFDTKPYFTLLDLQNNDFSGPIPQAFSRLIMLDDLNVKENKRLKGTVVSSFLNLDYAVRIKERASDTCPSVKLALSKGTINVDSSYYNRMYCYCDENYFGNGMHCIPCMTGGSCPGATKYMQSKPVKLLKDDKMGLPVSVMFLKRGYFPFPNASDVKSIHRCPSSGTYGKICAPEENCECYVSSIEEKVGIPDQDATAVSRTNIKCNKSCLCLLGHHGRYCSQCIDGYYKEGIHCYQCISKERKDVALGILFGATIGSTLITVAMLCITKNRLKLSVLLAIVDVLLIFILVLKHLIPAIILQIVIILIILGFGSQFRRCTALFKSAMFYLQSMDSLVSTTDIWPKSISIVQVHMSSSLNLSFSSLACTFPSFFKLLTKSFMLFLLPFISIGLLWLVYFLWKLVARPCKQKTSEFNCKCRKFSIFMIDLAYFPIVKSCFSVLVGCRDIEGVSFMKRYVWVDCNSSENIALAIIAVLELMLYVIAVPFLIYLPLLFHHRNHLSDDSSIIVNWLSPLITPYKPKYRAYIEVVMLLRRLLIAILLAAFPANSSLQIQCITIFLLIAIVFQAIARPFKTPNDVKFTGEGYNETLGLENGIDMFMLSCVLLSFVCVGLSAEHGYLVLPQLLKITLFINCIFIISFCCSILYRLLKPVPKEEDYGNSSDLFEPLIDVNNSS